MSHFTLFENDQKTCDVLSDFFGVKITTAEFLRAYHCLFRR